MNSIIYKKVQNEGKKDLLNCLQSLSIRIITVNYIYTLRLFYMLLLLFRHFLWLTILFIEMLYNSNLSLNLLSLVRRLRSHF